MKKDRENVLLFLEKISSSWDDKTALGTKSYIGWREYTYKGTSILSMRLGAYLIKQGLQKGDRISIISESKPEWAAAFFGSLLAGATIVPIDIKLTE
ncbi:MAG: AMP-binding protein, partial [Candidatus Gastranaerophilaceae bacterium]